MTVLSVSDVSHAFGDRPILENVNFAVNEGDRVGIIGVNGAGKTTLFRIIEGQLTPDCGNVYTASGLRIGMLAQHLHTDKDKGAGMSLLSFAEEAFLPLLLMERDIAECEQQLSSTAISQEETLRLSARLSSLHEAFSQKGGAEFRSRTRSMLLRMGFAEERLQSDVSDLSGGEQTRLALSKLLLEEPELLLLDEPTNHLDLDALAFLEDFLITYKKTVLVISHDRYFLDRVTNKTLCLEYGRAVLYPGSYSACQSMREADNASLEKRYKEQQKVIARIQKNIEFQRHCGQAHNFVTIRAKQKQLARMDKIALAPPPPKDIRLSFQNESVPTNDVLEVRNLSFAYNASQPLLRQVSFLINRGDRLVILGANGCGKSTLMKLMKGSLTPCEGHITLGDSIRIGYYDQENKSLHDDMTVFGELRAAFPQKTDFELRSTLALFLFGAEDIERQVGLLSGGERARLSLAKLVLQKVNLLLLDEPTNHLDIGSRVALERALDAFEGTVVVVSHDRYFIDLLATRIIELDGSADGGCIDYRLETYEGAYDTYVKLREQKRTKIDEQPAHPTVTDAKRDYEEKKRAAADERSARNRRERAKRRADEIEVEIARLTQELFGPAASDYVKAAAIQQQKDQLEEELLACYELLM